MNNPTDLAKLMRLAADALENSQRAEQRLDALRIYWDGYTDAERQEAVGDALERLRRVYEAQRV